MNIQNFISELSTIRSKNMFNPWGENCVLDAVPDAYLKRQVRLFEHFDCPSPRLLLIGEAPGFWGCRYSGIAFTGEDHIIAGNVPRITHPIGERITLDKNPMSEASANCVWETIIDLGIQEHVVMFNAVPWHPHESGDFIKNRTPSFSERKMGQKFLRDFLSYFNGLPVIALGRTAEMSLRKYPTKPFYVRHPSHGGSLKCKVGIIEICRKLGIHGIK